MEPRSEPTLDPDVVAYYDAGNEERRLTTIGRLEFVRTQELLTRFLPSPPARVVDVGGGAGIHALPLVERGYELHLVDPMPLHVERARAAGVRNATIGDARRLELDDAWADAALLLGPLYHLTRRDDRIAALREAYRVVRAGGVLCAAVISRFASTLDGLVRGFLDEAGFEEIVERDVAEGVHLNPTRREGWFTTAYFHHPGEVGDELAAAGWEVTSVVAVEGPAALLRDVDDRLDDHERRERLLRATRRIEADPSMLGATGHLLAAASKS
ncbi:MAG: class I SAM-dependent methyltransferase [Acidimicrobiia bacterium]